MKEHFDLLGRRAQDVVTGLAGVVTSISFDLSGCVMGLISPVSGEKGDLPDSRWFDTKRLRLDESDPVMAQPTFETVPGGQALPALPEKPGR